MDSQMDVLLVAVKKDKILSFEDAERLKKGDTLPSVTDDQRQQILRSVSDILTLEIQKTFDFFRATASGENIQRIVAAGGAGGGARPVCRVARRVGLTLGESG